MDKAKAKKLFLLLFHSFTFLLAWPYWCFRFSSVHKQEEEYSKAGEQTMIGILGLIFWFGATYGFFQYFWGQTVQDQTGGWAISLISVLIGILANSGYRRMYRQNRILYEKIVPHP